MTRTVDLPGCTASSAAESAAMARAAIETLTGKVRALNRQLEDLARADSYFIERKLFPNVDYYSAIVLDAVGISTDMMTPLFAMSRIAGWSAHIIEQWADNRLIRPRGNYIGDTDRRYVPLSER